MVDIKEESEDILNQKESSIPNDEDNYFNMVTWLNESFFALAKQFPLSVQLTAICTLLASIYPETNISLEEFMNAVNGNVKILIENISEDKD